MYRLIIPATAVLIAFATAAPGQSWYFAWDGGMDICCAPTVEGANPFWLRPTDVPSYAEACYWEIADNGLGGKAFRIVDQSTSKMLRWQGAGSRPEHYRGACNAFAHENFRPDHNAVTVTMRFKVEDFIKSSEDTRRFFNFEFETVVPKPSPTVDHTTYQMRFEATGCWKDGSGNLWLRDLRSGESFVIIKPAGGQAKWIKLWATIKLPNPPYVDNNCIYDLWIDQEDGQGWKSYPWQDRDKGGWSDVELGSLGEGERGNVNIDYLCWTYGAYAPGSIPIPAESRPDSPPNAFPGFDSNSIAHIRLQPDGYAVELTGKTVTGVYTDPVSRMPFYYVEEADRSSGIKIVHPTGKSPMNHDGQPVALSIGDRIDVFGGLGSANCEKQVVAHGIVRQSATGDRPAPVGVTNQAIQRSFSAALGEQFAPQALPVTEHGTIGAITAARLPWIQNPAYTAVWCSRISDTSRNWPADCWRGATLVVPAQGQHPDLYFTVVSNTSNTITLTRPSFLVSVDIADSNYKVAVGERYILAGAPPRGLRNDGLLVTAWGRVSSVDAARRVFYVDDGTGTSDFQTLQDIMIPYNSTTDGANTYSLFFPPRGVRVALQDDSVPMPDDGSHVRVTGCVGSLGHRFTIRATIGGSGRDDTKESKVMPVIWAESWDQVRP